MPYQVTKLALPDVLMLEPRVLDAAEGFFFESFNQRDFEAATGLNVKFVQDNHSRSQRNVLRGLHYQILVYYSDLFKVSVPKTNPNT